MNTIYTMKNGKTVRPKSVHKFCEGLGVKPKDIVIEGMKIG